MSRSLARRIASGIVGRIFARTPVEPLVAANGDLMRRAATHGKYRIDRFGADNDDKTFYVIARSPGSGFFSNMTYVLNHLKIADSMGFVPIVDMKNFPVIYNEAGGDLLPKDVVDAGNAWEYYFRQVSGYSLDDVYRSRHCVITDGAWPEGMTMSVASDPSLADIWDKYIRVRPEISDYVAGFVDEHFAGKKVLGVHFRGQELRTTPSHPMPPTPEQVVRRMRAILGGGGFGAVFLSTEEKEYLDIIASEFGGMVCHTNYFRTHGRNAYLMRPRDNHRFLLGKEVLQDMLILSRCDHLVRCGSNVSEVACLVGRFDRSRISRINNGMNSSSRLVSRYLWHVKRRLPEKYGGFARG